jgi:heterotetrameric sarcosine oxidase gamma subunit
VSEAVPVARSPIPISGATTMVDGWVVAHSYPREPAALGLIDCTPLAKVLVRAASDPFETPTGRTSRPFKGVVAAACRPQEWVLYAAPGSAGQVIEKVTERAPKGELVTVLDITHGRALLRLNGSRAPELLAKLCGIDLSEAVTPNQSALRTSVAKLTTELVRDDRDGVRSYLLSCDRSYGAYLFEALLDAGREFAVEPQGFAPPGI